MDKEKLRTWLKPVVEFQRRHNARIYVGEFSACIYAPGAGQYLRDCISLQPKRNLVLGFVFLETSLRSFSVLKNTNNIIGFCEAQARFQVLLLCKE